MVVEIFTFWRVMSKRLPTVMTLSPTAGAPLSGAQSVLESTM